MGNDNSVPASPQPRIKRVIFGATHPPPKRTCVWSAAINDDDALFERASDKMKSSLTSDSFKTREDAQTTSVPHLLEIIDRGMITFGSQEGLVYQDINIATNEPYIHSERAFVEGVMKTQHASRFVKCINANTDKVAFTPGVRRRDHPSYDTATDVVRLRTTRRGEIAPASFIVTKEDNDPYTYIPTTILDEDERTFFIETLAGLVDDGNYTVVRCVDPIYGRLATSSNGLYGNVVRCLWATRGR